MKVSLLMLTIDRFETTVDTWKKNITNARYGLDPSVDLELLVCDNGSKDPRVAEYFGGMAQLDYFRGNQKNEGVGHAFNQLYLRATGEVIALIGPDLLNDKGWLQECLGYALKVPNSGVIGIDWGHGGVPPLTTKLGSIAHWLTPHLNRIFGTCVFRRRLVEEIGLFHEGYDVYGIEDSDWNERVNLAGFNSCYVPNTTIRCQHLCPDVGERSEYRQMKDRSLSKNLALFHDRITKFTSQGVVEPLPPKREPLCR